MIFASDNWAGAHPAIAERLFAETGHASAYGSSPLDAAVEARLCDIFDREVSVYFVGTGTAANSLALASVTRPGGVTFCHREAHILTDECGAPGFFAHGARLHAVDGPAARMDPADLEAAISRFPPGGVHFGQAAAVSITQLTELGTLYSLDEIEAIATVARARNLPLHMDGARFANALVALGTTPAEMTWKRGVDMLSFGGTKNGCWCAEALIFFNKDLAAEMPFLRKRSAQLFSKSRFMAAQFDAYLKGGLWLELAGHANAMADALRAGIAGVPGGRLGWETAANEIFAILPKTALARARSAGAAFYEWPAPAGVSLSEGEDLVRLVTSFATTHDEIDSFITVLQG